MLSTNLLLRHRLLANMIHTDSTTDFLTISNPVAAAPAWPRSTGGRCHGSFRRGRRAPLLWAQRTRGVEVENMRVGFDASQSSLRASNSFKIGTWTPVWVQLRGGSEPWSGFMELSVADDDGTPTAFRMPVAVGANQSERFTAYARPGSRQPEFTIRLLDQNGRRVGGASQDAVMPQAPESIMPNETLLLMMGRPQGVEAIKDLPGFQSSGRAASRNGGPEILTGRIDPQQTPRCPDGGTGMMQRKP